MDIAKISKGCKERGLDELFMLLSPLARNAIRIDTQAKNDDDIAVGASKFGGSPDLPDGLSWPSNENGALSFVAQINFAEASKFDIDSLLPKSGMLYLFYDRNLRVWGYDPANKKGFAVIFSEVAKDQLARQNMDSGNFTFGARSLSFRNELNLPSLQSSIVPFSKISEAEWEAYHEVIEPSWQAKENKLLGHSDNVQDGMELECELVANGLSCGDGSAYHHPRIAEFEKNSAQWQLLLQIDSDDEGDMDWDGEGRVYLWIKRDDLAVRDFSKTWLVLQTS
ncbi:YwqG family protein [Campylobacter concisus]|uniref:YwqG family protein n=1 Tax=Campylobacter concisus TaxID=199 RepID=UPI000D31096D|nr:YwqG family protein [Campylobacter concisus]